MLNAVKELRMKIQLTLFLAAILFCGCATKTPEQSPTATVKGIVLLDELPVDEAKVVFVPASLRNADEDIMQLAYGITDVDGSFELAYSDGTTELLAGTYTVLISRNVPGRGGQDGTNEPWRKSLLPDSMADLMTFEEPEKTIPPIYNRDSKLTFELKGSSSVVRPKFELTSLEMQQNQEPESESR